MGCAAPSGPEDIRVSCFGGHAGGSELVDGPPEKREFPGGVLRFRSGRRGGIQPRDINRLLSDAGIIRNRLKIEAAVGNALRFLAVQKEFGSFDRYLWGIHRRRTDPTPFPRYFGNTAGIGRIGSNQQGYETAGLQVCGFNHHLCTHAGYRHGERSPDALFSVQAGLVFESSSLTRRLEIHCNCKSPGRLNRCLNEQEREMGTILGNVAGMLHTGLPANWAQLTPEQKREWRLNNFLNPTNLQFVGEKAKNEYKVRARRLCGCV